MKTIASKGKLLCPAQKRGNKRGHRARQVAYCYHDRGTVLTLSCDEARVKVKIEKKLVPLPAAADKRFNKLVLPYFLALVFANKDAWVVPGNREKEILCDLCQCTFGEELKIVVEDDSEAWKRVCETYSIIEIAF